MSAAIPSQIVDQLIAAACAVRRQAYSPYSGFAVGAAIYADDGQIYAGANVENAAYPLGQCAESSAIGLMVSAGARRLRAIAISGGGEHLCTPCGGCRQRIREFADANTPVLICDEHQLRQQFLLGDLLPAAFAPENLPPPEQ